MRVLITGAGSYLGGAILGALRKQGVEADELDVRGALPEKAFQGYDRVDRKSTRLNSSHPK